MFDEPQPIRCAMDGCTKHLERHGGRFHFVQSMKAMVCHNCYLAIAGNNTVFNSAKNLWEFTTTHFNGEKIHVRNLGHLRALEKEYGCSNQAANNYEAHWNIAPSVRENQMVIPREHMSHGSFRPEEHR